MKCSECGHEEVICTDCLSDNIIVTDGKETTEGKDTLFQEGGLVCPFITRPHLYLRAGGVGRVTSGGILHKVLCFQEQCMAWEDVDGGRCKLIAG